MHPAPVQDWSYRFGGDATFSLVWEAQKNPAASQGFLRLVRCWDQ
jgi:hypothetical protein